MFTNVRFALVRAMAPVPHEFVTVDMRGLKGALIERSRSDRVSVSSLVRAFVARGLGLEAAGALIEPPRAAGPPAKVKVAIRMTAAEARQFADGARQAGISRAAYLAELIAGAPQGITSATRSEQLALLVSANAELSILSRNVRHLSELLSVGSVQAAQEYSRMLSTIAGDVRRHLSLSSALLSDVRSRRPPAAGRPPSARSAAKEGHG